MSNIMKFDPATGQRNPYPSEAKQYREWHGKIAWLFNPYTGARRDARDVGSDTFGQLIVVGQLIAARAILAKRGGA